MWVEGWRFRFIRGGWKVSKEKRKMIFVRVLVFLVVEGIMDGRWVGDEKVEWILEVSLA